MIGVVGGSTIWYLSRGTGIATLVLLTATVVTGILTSVRWSANGWPRFVVEYVHRNATLVVLVLLLLHVATVVLDGFAPIGWKDVVVPFASPYRPVWLGLGAIAVDLLLAIAISSWLRQRVGYRTWRTLHWLAYAAWPLAVVHGLATGTDTRERWAVLVSAACVVTVIVAIWWRLAVGGPNRVGIRALVLAATLVLPLVGFVWLRTGPLAPRWAKRSGTPSTLIRGAPRTGGTGRVRQQAQAGAG